MKKLILTQYGPLTKSLQLRDMDKPDINDNEILIQVHAIGINPIDYKIASGYLQGLFDLDLPAGIGYDVSGVIQEAGSQVKHFKVGDAVFSRVRQENIGTVAEYAVANQADITLKPKQITFEQAAAMPLAGLTAYQALLQAAQLKKDEKILIHAGSGGVGSFAVQIAHRVGAKVSTTTSSSNVAWVKALGAKQVIDYKKENYLDQGEKYDVIFDTLGSPYDVEAFKVIKKGGRIISIAGALDQKTAREWGVPLTDEANKIDQLARQKNVLYRFLLMKPDAGQLTELSQWYLEGTVKPVIDRIFPLNDYLAAYHYLSTGRAKGKVILIP